MLEPVADTEGERLSGSSGTVSPYGSWESPISAGLVASGGVRLSAVSLSGPAVYWLEGRATEGGRQVLVRWSPDDGTTDVTPPGWNVRSRVHEYGGGAYLVAGDNVFFSSFADQRLFRAERGGPPIPLTPDRSQGPSPPSVRYADGRLSADRHWLICLRETHRGEEVRNEVVAVSSDGSGTERVLATGRDFYAAPRPSPDGRRLAFVAWDLPNMPWDGTELWVAELVVGKDGPELTGAARRAGGPSESVGQPCWSPSGSLYYVSDRSGWWNLYRTVGDRDRAVAPMEAEQSGPQWSLDLRTFGFLGDGRVALVWSSRGVHHLSVTDPETGRRDEVDLPYTHLSSIDVAGDTVAVIGASPSEPAEVATVSAEGERRVLRRSMEAAVAGGAGRAGPVPDRRYLSAPEPIEFPTVGGRERRLTAYGLYYRPRNPRHIGPGDELPPLVVSSHGGPTSAATMAFDLTVQYFTSRGFAWVEVDYGGSTGYGRAYRERLLGQWGVVDVDDCVAAARYLVDRGEVDPARLVVRGASAGGWTTLCALTFRDLFAAGASYYGIADAAALARDTHKFESRYLDRLIGPYPDSLPLYAARSPIQHTEGLSAAMIVLQGLEDPIVPPAQAEAMVASLRTKGLPHAFLAFEGESHGFRRAETIRRSLDAELSFYGQVLGFDPAGEIEPVTVQNLRR
jgi:dipeptidyl aminopeptidase/acylaminoacyl peptidase